jgi:hypothetical protein
MNGPQCAKCASHAKPGARFCPGCGAPLVETAVAGAAGLPSVSPIPPEQGLGDRGPMVVTGADLDPKAAPEGSEAPVDPRTGSRWWRWVLVAAGVVILGGVGWSVTRGLSGESGGASDPEAAVRALAEALDREDPTGVAAALVPDEVRSLSEVLRVMERRAQGLELAGESDAFAGIDIQVEGLRLSVDELSDTAARVDIDDGRGRWTIRRDELGTRLRAVDMETSYSGGIDRDELVWEGWVYSDFDERLVEVEPFLIVVKRDGGWYVSPFLTGMAWLAEVLEVSDGDYRSDLDARASAETPEEAVASLFDTIDLLDPEETLRYLPSGEFALLHIYRDAIEDYVDEFVAPSEGFVLDVDRHELVVQDLSGGRKMVTIEGASGIFETTDWDGRVESYSWELEGLCLEWTSRSGERGGEGCLSDSHTGAALLGALGIDAPFVVVERDRGGWVVSPMATIVQYGDEILSDLSDAWILRLLGLRALAPVDAEITPGQAVEGVLNDAGFAVVEVDLQEGQRVVATQSRDDEHWIDAYSDGLNEAWGLLRGDSVERSGRYVLVVQGDAGDDFGFTLATLEARDVSADGRASGTLSADSPVALYRFRVPTSGSYRVEDVRGDLLSNTSSQIEDADGSWVCSIDSDCDLDSGVDYLVSIRRFGGSSSGFSDFELVVRAAPVVAIDGGARATGYVSNGSRSHHSVEVPSGTRAVVELTWPTSADLDLYCASAGACASSTSTTPGEQVSIDGPYTGEIYVYGFRGGSDYELTIRAG